MSGPSALSCPSRLGCSLGPSQQADRATSVHQLSADVRPFQLRLSVPLAPAVATFIICRADANFPPWQRGLPAARRCHHCSLLHPCCSAALLLLLHVISSARDAAQAHPGTPHMQMKACLWPLLGQGLPVWSSWKWPQGHPEFIQACVSKLCGPN